MSYYFTILSPAPASNPVFEYHFGTSKPSFLLHTTSAPGASTADGSPHFNDKLYHLLPFIVHSSLDIVEEVQWTTGAMYLKQIDKWQSNLVWYFLAGGGAKLVLVWCPEATSGAAQGLGSEKPGQGRPGSATGMGIGKEKTGKSGDVVSAMEEPVRAFFAEVYENWIKTVMSPFFVLDKEVQSPVFKGKVAAAGRRFL
ncbi:MAG: TRAPP subunit [Chrysothrix sp. TS-e1954]|nr:MAG: TRAPP subunit [Chrysothrix sp. TS-e1954]